MTVTYGFYDSLAGDRKYNALQMSRLFEGIISDGVLATVGNALVVTANPGTMTVNVGSGRAWFFYTWTYNDSNFVLTVLPSEAALNRTDTVVLEVNTELSVRANSFKIVKGTPGAGAPTLTNTSTIKQYALADIFVASGVTQITAGNITNRIGTTGTPFVTGVVSTIDFSTLLGRFESNFNAWLANLETQLSTTEQAGNLQTQINTLMTRTGAGWIAVTDTWTRTSDTTVTVPTDATLKYNKWMRVRLKQGGAFKYFIITAVAATQLTLWAGSDNVVAAGAITDIAYSLEDRPYGFSKEFNFVPTSNITMTGGTLTAKLNVSPSGLVNGHLEFVFGAGSAIPTNANFVAPFVPGGYAAAGVGSVPIGTCRYKDATGGAANLGMLVMAPSTGTCFFLAQDASLPYVVSVGLGAAIPFTWANADDLEANFTYFAA